MVLGYRENAEHLARMWAEPACCVSVGVAKKPIIFGMKYLYAIV